MDDLFRFVLLRPANLPDSSEVKSLNPPSIDIRVSRAEARRQAVQLLNSDRVVPRVEDLALGSAAIAVYVALSKAPMPAEDLRTLISDVAGTTPEDLVARAEFATEEGRLADTLVATKLVSDSARTDARALAEVAQGYDAIRSLVAGADPVRLRPLAMPLIGSDKPSIAFPDRQLTAGDAVRGPQGEPEPPPSDPQEEKLARLDAAIAALSRVKAHDFHMPAPPVDMSGAGAGGEPAVAAEGAGTAAESAAVAADVPTVSGRAALEVPWQLSEAAVRRVNPEVVRTVAEVGMDLATDALPAVLNELQNARVETLTTLNLKVSDSAKAVFQVGGDFLDQAPASDYVGTPSSPMPTGHGSIRPVGIADLLLVKQHVLRYEGGEVAHVENVLKSEHLSRDTRRLERTETTVLTETETTKEDERDTQSTDRFSLKRETSSTLKSDTEFKAGLSVDAKYGPFVEVKANADFATKTSSEESAKQASEFSKDVVSRSVSKVVERVLERRSTTTISEFEEKYSHGFDNTAAGSSNISGVYQWVDKVLQAQVYNYGKRMLFDVTLPEPGTAFIVAQTANKLEGQAITKPVPFTLTANQINEGNYAYWGHQYDVTGLEAPPPPVKTISKAFDAAVSQDPNESSKSADLTIDDGYQADYALFQRGINFYSGAAWQLMIGSNWVDGFGSAGYFNMAAEVASVSISYFAWKVRDLAATIEIFCRRTDRAMKAWQLKTHAAITQGYLAKQQAYESKLAEAAAATGVVIAGRNPMWNQRITTTELRKQCLTLLTAQQFDAFGALELSAQGYPQPNLARAEAQMPYVRFFEQAFEWEHLVYFFYPYFWGWKQGWQHRMLLDDVDPLFADFLRAGAARVVFPVRPGFEAAVIHYLETGEIWNGGPAPDVTDPMYVPIVKEIQEAQGAPGNEVPQGDPWLVRLPTTLAKLRPHDDLPEWHKVGEDWQPAN